MIELTPSESLLIEQREREAAQLFKQARAVRDKAMAHLGRAMYAVLESHDVEVDETCRVLTKYDDANKPIGLEVVRDEQPKE